MGLIWRRKQVRPVSYTVPEIPNSKIANNVPLGVSGKLELGDEMKDHVET